MIDGENAISKYMLNIVRVTSYLEIGERVVICCRAGVSRSNAIAVGVLVCYFKMDFYEAMMCLLLGIIILTDRSRFPTTSAIEGLVIRA